MFKLIGIKELQKNTKKIRKDIEKGITFVVVYRSKPIFEIKPIAENRGFSGELEATKLYSDGFIKRMAEAEKDIKKGKTKAYSTKEFLKSLE